MTRNELDAPGAHALLEQACRLAGISAGHAHLVRVGSNAVFRLTSPVVARISRRGEIDAARRTVGIAQWLHSAGYPAVHLADIATSQPIILDGHAVTFWEAVSGFDGEYATTAEVAELLARLHALTPPAGLDLPALDPFGSVGNRLATNARLSPGDMAFLTSMLTKLREAYDRLDFVLPRGVIHGDANVGNVLHDYSGKPVVIDLDSFAIGPREWDLALTAIYYDSFGWHTRDQYDAFACTYGYDIIQWRGYPVMCAVREFLMVTWIIQKAADAEDVAAEARRRIADLRTGASRKSWKPF